MCNVKLIFVESCFDVSVDFIKRCHSFDDFEDSISFQVDHSSLKRYIFHFKCWFSIQEHIFYFISIIHHLKDTYSAFVSASFTERTFIPCFRIFSASYIYHSIVDEIIPLLLVDSSADNLFFERFLVKIPETLSCKFIFRVYPDMVFLCYYARSWD